MDPPVCDFCTLQRAMVYCESDTARLCFDCDSCVHSANWISRRHERSLLCEKCFSHPATVSCIEDKISFCQDCNWNENFCSGPGHHCQKLNSYKGCPSLDEYPRLWSSVLDFPATRNVNNTYTTLTSDDNCVNPCLESKNNEGSDGLVTNRLNDLESTAKFEPWIPPGCIVPCNKDQGTFLSDESTGPRQNGSSNLKDLGSGGLCECSVDMDDVALILESGYELLDSTEDHSRFDRDDRSMIGIPVEKNLSVTESSSHLESTQEASLSGQQEGIGYQSAGQQEGIG